MGTGSPCSAIWTPVQMRQSAGATTAAECTAADTAKSYEVINRMSGVMRAEQQSALLPRGICGAEQRTNGARASSYHSAS
jgi:hypothetical protein